MSREFHFWFFIVILGIVIVLDFVTLLAYHFGVLR